jgi:hypothetical protein
MSTTFPVCVKNSAASFVGRRACYVPLYRASIGLKFDVLGDKDIETKILDFDIIFIIIIIIY